MDLETELKRLFGYERFRPGQKPLVEALLGGRDAVGILPTGGGKSLCYQLPALLTDGLTVVVSPLIALMKDQVDGLRRRGIAGAAEIHSHLAAGEAGRRLRDAAAGRLRLLYLAPERLAHPGTLDALRRCNVRTFVVDEAHCISHWGHDFRPDYLVLAARAASLGARATLALTATATPRVREEIARLLGMKSPCVIVNPFDRPNLFLGAVECARRRKIEEAAGRLGREGAGIVYVGRQADTVDVAARLGSLGIPAVAYHGGMEREERTRAQDDWIAGRARVVVGTIAFGMGIDKPDVRAVIHLHLPSSLEACYQEIGRAGRDGLPARCDLLWEGRDLSLQRWFIDRRYPSEFELRAVHARLAAGETPPPDEVAPEKVQAARAWLLGQGFLAPGGACTPLPDSLDLAALHARRRADEARLAAMEGWARSETCRRAALLRYFGERVPRDLDCRNCDNCLRAARRPHPQAGVFGLYTGRRDPDEPAVRKAVSSAVEDLGPKGLDRPSVGKIVAGDSSAARRGVGRVGHLGSLRGLPAPRRRETEEALIEEGAFDAVPGPRPRLAPAGKRSLVDLAPALSILRLLSSRPGRLTRTALLRLLPGARAVWAAHVEMLARAGYVTADGEARLLLTGKGAAAVEVAERRGISG